MNSTPVAAYVLYAILLVLIAMQQWACLSYISTRDGHIIGGTRAHVMRTAAMACGFVTAQLFLCFSTIAFWMDLISSISDAHRQKGLTPALIAAVLVPTLLLAITLIPMDILSAEYMALRTGMKQLAPTQHGHETWFHATFVPILLRSLLCIFGLGMYALLQSEASWSTIVPVFLLVTWCVLLLPFALYVRHWRGKWMREIVAVSIVPMHHVHVQESALQLI